MSYRRPYLPQPTGGADKPPADPPPVYGRYPLPANRPAGVTVAKFVVQVLLFAAVAVFVARALGSRYPHISTLLFLWATLCLGCSALVKWAWEIWIPTFTIVTAGATGLLALTLLTASIGRGTFIFDLAPYFALGGVGLGIRVSWVIDHGMKKVGWETVAGLAVAAFTLLLVGLISRSPRASAFLTFLALGANSVFVLTAANVNAGYMLANTAIPAEKVERERWLWRRVFWGDATRIGIVWIYAAGYIVAVVLGLMFASAPMNGDACFEKIHAQCETEDQKFLAVVLTGAALFAMPFLAAGFIAWNSWIERHHLWQTVRVWMLVDGEPAPGIYRPRGPLGSRRVRQLAFAALLFLNVVQVRCRVGEGDLFVLSWVGPMLQHVGSITPAGWVMTVGALLLELLSLVAPLVWPLLMYAFLGDMMARFYHRLEGQSPESPYYTGPNRT